MSAFWSVPRTILVTGGGSGIGLAFAQKFSSLGHKVIIVGRRRAQLDIAVASCPSLVAIVGDVSSDAGRIALADELKADHPALDVVVNNAGIQHRLPPLAVQAAGSAEEVAAFWARHREEISINVEGPIHLSMLLLPLLLNPSKAPEAGGAGARIINVSSGLSFVPMAVMPTYCATKAFLHSFTQSLRHQLHTTHVSVVEVIPPAVQTDLGGAGLHTFGEPLDAFTNHIFDKMLESDDNVEIGYKMSENARLASKDQLASVFQFLNKPH